MAADEPVPHARVAELRRELDALVSLVDRPRPRSPRPDEPSCPESHDGRRDLSSGPVAAAGGLYGGSSIRSEDEPAPVATLSEAAPGRRRVMVPRLGEFLVQRGLATQEDIDHALKVQRTTGRRLGETLVELGVVSRLALSEALAAHFGFPFINLDEQQPDPEAVALIAPDVAERYDVVPVRLINGGLLVAMADPRDVFTLDDLRYLTNRFIRPAFADPEQLQRTIKRLFTVSTINASAEDSVREDTEADDGEPEIALDEGPIVRLVNSLLQQAIAERASDIHIEPDADAVALRLRIDGILHDATQLPRGSLRAVISRLKVLGGLDIAQRRLPQDGRFSVVVGDRNVDVRVATMSTVAGEAAVLRLLDPERGAATVAELALTERDEHELLSSLRASQGGIFITGPTGSGKSSTVYAAMETINTRDKSVVSVEDPVEYQINGVKQIEVNLRAGITFAKTLRSVLRVDPDVIVIGEVRDAETARIAADASITGHLVISTLHTTSAAAAPMRLVDMGVEPYLVASALTCIVSQRLVRRLCDKCATPDPDADYDLLLTLGVTPPLLDAPIMVRRAKGCSECSGTGYRGRVAVCEVMTVTDNLRRLIVDRAPTAEIERLAIDGGMETLRIAGLRRALAGTTSLAEVLRILC